MCGFYIYRLFRRSRKINFKEQNRLTSSIFNNIEFGEATSLKEFFLSQYILQFSHPTLGVILTACQLLYPIHGDVHLCP
jgi:hypothetical protein